MGEVKVYVLVVFLEFSSQENCQEEAKQRYPDKNIPCAEFTRPLMLESPPPRPKPFPRPHQ